MESQSKTGPGRARLLSAGVAALVVVAAVGVYMVLPGTNTPTKAAAAARFFNDASMMPPAWTIWWSLSEARRTVPTM